MFKNILVGVDGGPGGRDAIALGRELLDDGGQMTLGHVHGGYELYGQGYVEPVPDDSEEMLAAERDRAGLDAKLLSVGETVGAGLHRLVEETSADLIVVGSSRRGLIGRVMLGDDTAAALDGAPCPVAVAPAAYDEQPHVLREIGVAYNGSPEAARALELARALAAQHEAGISVMDVIGIPGYGTAWGPVVAPPPIDELLAADRARLAQLGVEAHVVYGVPSEELALYSASVSLLVVGSRGYGPLGRLVHGSTTRRLLKLSRCPLLAITRLAGA